MVLLVYICGVLLFLAGLSLLYRPEILFGYLKQHYLSTGLYFLAIILRILVGVLLIISAEISKYPTVIVCIGWLAILSGSILFCIGKSRFSKLMSWMLFGYKPYSRVWGIFAAGAGFFLVYAFL